MSKTTKRSLLYALGLLVLIAFAMWLRYASRYYFHSPAASYLRSAIYLFLFSVWCYSLWARIVQVQVRHYMLAISALMVLWILLRSIKFSIDNTDAERLLWYFYYFRCCLSPCCRSSFPVSGKGEDFRLPRWTKLLYLPTLLAAFARSGPMICISRYFLSRPAFYRTGSIGMRSVFSSCWAGRLCAQGLRFFRW